MNDHDPKRSPASLHTTSRTAPERRGSLFERAGNAFGFDSLKPPEVPPLLDDDHSRRIPKKRVPTTKKAARVDGYAQKSELAGLTKRDVQETPVTGVTLGGEKHAIVRSLLREQGLIDPEGGASRLLEEFRIVKRQVLATAKASGDPLARRVLISSPHQNEGKTFCALNLAIALAAERDSEILLIDADFGKPSVLARLGLEAKTGFMDVLANPELAVEDAVMGTDISGLWVLGAGTRTGSDSEYLASDRTKEVLARLTQDAPNRIIVFDSPPALAATPAAELAKHVGQALLVARADQTGKAAIEDALDLLAACGDIRLLLNDATFSPSGRRFGSYYGYGEGDT